MFGRRSLDSILTPLDPELDRTLREIRDNLRRQSSTQRTTTTHAPPLANPIMANQGGQPNPPEANRRLRDNYVPQSFANASPIVLPDIEAAHYEIKAHILNNAPKFNGLPSESPYMHINALLSLCSTFRIQGVTDDALMLRLFPLSLADRAKQWFDSLPSNSITTWGEMESAFLMKYFPPCKTTQSRKAISSFKQQDGENFHECWERFNDLLRKCPHHNIDKFQLIQYFYEGLDEKYRTLCDASCGGAIMNKNEREAWELFTVISENSLLQVQSSRENQAPQAPKRGGVYEVTATNDLSAKVDSMCRQFNHFMSSQRTQAQQAPPPPTICEVCSIEGHSSQECPSFFEYSEVGNEQVNAVNPRNDPYSLTFNPGWAKHPNFGWSQGNQGTQSSNQGGYQNSYQNQPPQNSYQNRGSQQQSQQSQQQTYLAPHQRASYQGGQGQQPYQNRNPYPHNNNQNQWQSPNTPQNLGPPQLFGVWGRKRGHGLGPCAGLSLPSLILSRLRLRQL